MEKRQIIALWIALPLLMAGCAHYSKVTEKKGVTRLAATEEQKILAEHQKRLKNNPLAQIGRYLDSANASRTRLAANPKDALARSDYNFAVARIIEIIEDRDFSPWDAPLRCESVSGNYWNLGFPPPDPRPEYHPKHFEVLPTDRYDFTGKLVGERSIHEGLGAPVVVVGRDVDFTKIDQFAQGKQVFYGLTATIRFDGPNCEVVLSDPLEREEVKLDQHTYQLAADFQAPLALALSELNLEKRELAGLFKPQEFADQARLARLQPYNPNKIPVLCIHGLGNSPATWAPVIEFLRSDPEIRQHYQFWFYSYPSGLPYPYSTAILRNQLKQMRARYPGHKDMVVIGHSMGGMISRLLLTDSGMKIWDANFAKPPGEIPFSEGTRDLISRSLIFDAAPDISRVIFFSASHRGSDVATSGLGKFGAKLVGDPFADNSVNEEVLAFARPEVRNNKRNRLPNSVDMLDPENRFLALVDSLPLNPGVPYHSIIGDRGKGGHLDHSKPVSNDGIVPYWSSHLEGAESELIIPSDHWSHLHPQGMAEAKRILLLHLGRR
jgi:pimeloyl-ACP methyl ester carboxylesterase